MKRVVGSKQLRADLKLIAGAVIVGLIVGNSLVAESVTPANAPAKIETRAH